MNSSLNPRKRKKVNIFEPKHKAASVLIDLIKFFGEDNSVIGHYVGCNSLSSVLQPGRVYTVGRSNRHTDFVFNDPRVSKQHCQLLVDGFCKKLYLLNGVLSVSSSTDCARYDNDCSSCNYDECIVNEFRHRLFSKDKVVEEKGKSISCCSCRYVCKGALNGVFVNGVRVGEGSVVELGVGDEILLGCGNRGRVCSDSRLRIGFLVRRIVFHEELVESGFDGYRSEGPRFVRPFLGGRVNKRILASWVSDSESLSFKCDNLVDRAKSLSAHCNHIAGSYDPVSCIRHCVQTHSITNGSYFCQSKGKNDLCFELNEDDVNTPRKGVPQENVALSKIQFSKTVVVKDTEGLKASITQSANVTVACEMVAPLEPTNGKSYVEDEFLVAFGSTCKDHMPTTCPKAKFSNGRNEPIDEAFGQKESPKKIDPPGKNFYLNRLDSMLHCLSEQENAVSLPELLHPVASISSMFIATFTSDIGWFLSYCDIPSHLPITIACHNTERCWSADPGKRTCVPAHDFPNLIVVYPPFPEVIAFGKKLSNKGVGCHHPKLFVLQREDSLRVIITSANLVAKQWKSVTNTVWWQDFPRRVIPDCTPLFNKFDGSKTSKSASDFAAQLAGFMASLITDVPSQAHWIFELTKFDFTEASAHLIASVPGIHSYRSVSTHSNAFKSNCSERFLGSVIASVVGLSHRFQSSADSNGVQLKKLAAYLAQSSNVESGMTAILLQREKHIPQDVNAVSVLVSNPKQLCNGDVVQLGFLPRTVAKWVSSLWDIGFFTFHGYVCPREALAAAFGESNSRVQLLLHVSQGPNFQEVMKTMKPEQIVAFCSLIASLQRCTGLWRLEEVLHQYKWPESMESDFIYGASSIGTSVGPQFCAAFSAAAGKKSQDLYDSQESDPEWGIWNASHEMKCPSIRIIFPTIDRVKSSQCGITPSKHTLSFSEKTWQRLKPVDILHDAVPYPNDRVGHPMHVKVARRRFKSNTGASCGWIYCGSHNISAAAWGRPVSSQSRGPQNGNSSGLRLHVCNYELGCIFVFPPPCTKDRSLKNPTNLDDIRLPFVVPAPKYEPSDKPATMRAMSEALAELVTREGRAFDGIAPMDEEAEAEVEDDEVEVANYAVPEAEEEKAYADVLWHQVDSSQSS